jgi:hypothetical protein
MNPLPFELTIEQAQVLKLLQQQRLIAVAGCAGSGKTSLAIEFARQLDGQGQKVLLLCRNPYLAEDLALRLKPTRVSVYAFTSLIQDLKQGSQAPDVFVPRSRPRWTAAWSQYEVPTQADLNRALDILAKASPRYQAVIVDEGQDFEDAWLEVAEACLQDPDTGRLAFFFDDNQRLAPFGPQRIYAAIQSPIALNRNFRSAGEIEALVRQLHSGDTVPGLHAAEPGSYREWVYSCERELLDSLHQALLAGEELSPRLENVVVISAENASSRMSKFAGLVFDSPGLRTAPSPGRLNWQVAVLRYLQGFGLLESQLSEAPSPALTDIKNVNKFCDAYKAAHRAVLSRHSGYVAQTTLLWVMDAYGELHLRWQDGNKRDLLPIDLLRFFGSSNWAAALPSAHKRYRLTPAAELSNHPDAYPVRLTDSASFKGLDADGVVFVLYNYFAENDDQLLASLYVVFSRARRWLHVVTPSDSYDGTSQVSGF